MDAAYRRRARKVAWWTALLGPGQVYSRWRHARAVAAVKLHPEPVFLIGHWQAGHSYLHELLCQDEQFAHVTLLHSVLPRSFLTHEGLARRFLSRRLGRTRHVDTLPLSLDAPQGDDMALAGLCDVSIYHAYTFPRSAERCFRRAVLLEGLTERARADWQAAYLAHFRRVALHAGRSRILSRNATNTGRIPQILAMFPEARFIHLRRNPYAVYAAQARRWTELLRLWALQDASPLDTPELVLSFYRRMLEKCFADAAALPARQYVEVAYEDLLRQPLQTVRGLYNQLDVTGFEAAEPRLGRFLESATGQLDGSESQLSAAEVELVSRHWGFAAARWGYAAPLPRDRPPQDSGRPTHSD